MKPSANAIATCILGAFFLEFVEQYPLGRLITMTEMTFAESTVPPRDLEHSFVHMIKLKQYRCLISCARRHLHLSTLPQATFIKGI